MSNYPFHGQLDKGWDHESVLFPSRKLIRVINISIDFRDVYSEVLC